MADLDVTELLSDPDFIDALGVIRRSVAFSAGAAVVTDAPEATIYGSVQPAGADDLELLPEGTRLHDSLVLYTLAAVAPQTDDGPGDVLVWKGYRWVVRAVPEDWSHFGAGYRKALAVKEAVHA